ncbi:MAG: 30S ribosomal protein S12 methylthiotransferase RimO [Corynebacteriales bacterium]|nr:30S ribosomal protein S12 methylthiotransferase RimO [Mycobacteriales bacterium]
MSAPVQSSRRVSMVTLGCTRNDVDSEELAGRLNQAGWEFDDENPDVVLVNTCGFIEQAKQESVDTLLEAADTGAKVVAVGCMAERYGEQLAEIMPEADAVLSFDDYASIDDRLNGILRGEKHTAHTPKDRRTLLPITPVQRHSSKVATPGHHTVDLPEGVAPASGPRVMRRRLGEGPVAPLKLASGCDRRCTFCAIPSFRGSFLSRPPADVLAEAQWLAENGVKELFLVSENSTSYGKDLGDPRLLEQLLPQLAQVPGIERVRASYLQPAEMRPSLVKVLASTPGVVPYFDLSFQHASEPVLRRMRRFGSVERFWELLESVRALSPEAGARSNFIVGFPGETDHDFAELERFLIGARLDTIGLFAYSDEDGTEAVDLPDKVPADVVTSRFDHLSRLVEELTAQRAEDRVGETVTVLFESLEDDQIEGRAAHQAPEVDGITTIVDAPDVRVGDFVTATVVASDGVDLVAEFVSVLKE